MFFGEKNVTPNVHHDIGEKQVYIIIYYPFIYYPIINPYY